MSHPSPAQVRTGAAKDCVSLRVRAALEADWEALAPGWRPNPEPRDDDDWGGSYGKCCGHNEVVMHALRPFAPMEVLNTRCCSRAHPAPGNAGFDGCLEFLKSRAKRKRRPITVWDTDAFHCLLPDGVTDAALVKRDLLRWPQDRIDFVLPVLRRLTVATGGAVPPAALVARVDALLVLAADDAATLDGLPRAATVAVCAFVLGGDARAWRERRADLETGDAADARRAVFGGATTSE